MNKKPSRLSLTKETVRRLSPAILPQVAGGEASRDLTNCTQCSTPSYCGGRCLPTPSLVFHCETETCPL